VLLYSCMSACPQNYDGRRDEKGGRIQAGGLLEGELPSDRRLGYARLLVQYAVCHLSYGGCLITSAIYQLM
jgi:hypothetical protein